VIRVVRHADAGSRRTWTGPDHLRPLTDLGWSQAAHLAGTLPADEGELLSSPFTRCVQTLEPLARHRGSEVVQEPRLAEGAPPEPLVRLITDLPAGSVLCSHGDVIENLIGHLAASGASIDAGIATEKGGTWTLDIAGGRIRAGVYTPPAAR
jgi:broad specificity phosphatase PhoE